MARCVPNYSGLMMSFGPALIPLLTVRFALRFFVSFFTAASSFRLDSQNWVRLGRASSSPQLVRHGLLPHIAAWQLLQAAPLKVAARQGAQRAWEHWVLMRRFSARAGLRAVLQAQAQAAVGLLRLQAPRHWAVWVQLAVPVG